MTDTERLKARVGVLEGVLSDLLAALATSGDGSRPTQGSDPATPDHWHRQNHGTLVNLGTIRRRFEGTLLTRTESPATATAHELRDAAQKYADAHIETTAASPSYDRVQS